MVTKSDEYADPLPEGEEEEGLHAMLVVRCVGGRANAPWLQKQKSLRLRLSSPYTPKPASESSAFQCLGGFFPPGLECVSQDGLTEQKHGSFSVIVSSRRSRFGYPTQTPVIVASLRAPYEFPASALSRQAKPSQKSPEARGTQTLGVLW